ncbi:MAG: hypothetical protein L0Y66_25935, partial [Myxococcaceae bacterium]|nr:hypothetical protein [Myxococcaceae bacterium]
YGRQQLMTAGGGVLESEALNRWHFRTAEHVGLQGSELWAALVAQFPNDGYMVRTEAARSTGYRSREEVGDACDYDFGLRLASRFRGFWFLGEDTARYRLSETSVSRAGSNNAPMSAYLLLEALCVPEGLEAVRDERLQQHAPAAISNALRAGDLGLARRLYVSRHHPWSRRLSPRGLAQALLLASPFALGTFLMRGYRRG